MFDLPDDAYAWLRSDLFHDPFESVLWKDGLLKTPDYLLGGWGSPRPHPLRVQSLAGFYLNIPPLLVPQRGRELL